MATNNFRLMDNFPLIARDDDCYIIEGKRCPECGCIMDSDATECECCGCEDLEDYTYFDELACMDDFAAIKAELEDINRDLLFHKISVESGYYCGAQFYVKAEHDLDEYEYDNSDCHYYFDCCRSVAHRKYDAEKRKINRLLQKLGERYGFQEYVCVARFSNGEAWYELASNPRARLKAAVA